MTHYHEERAGSSDGSIRGSQSDEESVSTGGTCGDPGLQTQGEGAGGENLSAAGASHHPAAGDDEVAVLRAQVEDARERMMRALAESENVRKRVQRENLDARRYAVSSFARDMLVVLDDLRRCVESVERSQVSSNQGGPAGEVSPPELPESTRGLLDGVRLIIRSFERVLEQHGLRKIDPQVGERFDPAVHEALFQTRSDQVEPGHITRVMEVGYMVSDRLLRPARVGVAS